MKAIIHFKFIELAWLGKVTILFGNLLSAITTPWCWNNRVGMMMARGNMLLVGIS